MDDLQLGADEPISLLDLARLMIESAPAAIARSFPERRAIDISDYHGDYNPDPKVLGWHRQSRCARSSAGR
jgi:hypothetical protein